MTEAMRISDSKKWEKTHDAELDRNVTELRTWVYEEAMPSDKPIPLKMIYNAKKNQFGCKEKYEEICALRGEIMKPGQHFDETRAAF